MFEEKDFSTWKEQHCIFSLDWSGNVFLFFFKKGTFHPHPQFLPQSGSFLWPTAGCLVSHVQRELGCSPICYTQILSEPKSPLCFLSRPPLCRSCECCLYHLSHRCQASRINNKTVNGLHFSSHDKNLMYLSHKSYRKNGFHKWYCTKCRNQFLKVILLVYSYGGLCSTMSPFHFVTSGKAQV